MTEIKHSPLQKRCNQYTPAKERFEMSYIPEPNSGCWIWVGTFNPGNKAKAPDYRPRMNINGRPVTAYRFSYELFKGEIPKGMMICHTCDVSLCVNPEHLYAGTAKDNAQDALRRGRHSVLVCRDRMVESARRLGKRNTWSRGREMSWGVIPFSEYKNIRARLNSGTTQVEIAREYRITKQAVSQYLRRRRIVEAALAAVKEE